MYGKHFASMYSGSMVGAGALNFAVMGYVIAMMKTDKQYGAVVELNPKLLAAILGEGEQEVAQAIAFLSEPDEQSRSKEADGRRIVQVAQFEYQVVNGAKYMAIRNEEERREQNRLNKRAERERNARKKLSSHRGPTAREIQYERQVGDGKEPDVLKEQTTPYPVSASNHGE